MRPNSYTPEIAAAIIERLCAGEPLASICREDEMPAVRTVSDWRAANAGFGALFIEARLIGADALAAECLRIADTPLMGTETVTKADGTIETREGDMLGHRKLQIEARLKLLAKWFPKLYGDKVQLEHSGEIHGQSDRDINERISALLAKAAPAPGPKRGKKS